MAYQTTPAFPAQKGRKYGNFLYKRPSENRVDVSKWIVGRKYASFEPLT